jgi:hypothetical protein
MAAGGRMSARDRAWLGVDVAKVIGPLSGITGADLRRALVELHARRPDARAVCRVDRARGRWVPIAPADFPAWAERLVLDLDDDLDADEVTRRLFRERLEDRPILLGAGPTYVGFRMSHATGDGRVGDPLFADLLHAADSKRPVRTVPGTRLPLLTAIARHFGRHPGRLAAGLRVARPSRQTRGARTEGWPEVAWSPEIAHESARSAPDAMARLRQWRAGHAPGVSIGALLLSSVSAAFARHIDALPCPGVVLLVDARRYLPAGRQVDGNFAVGGYLEPADPADPRAVHDAMTAYLRSGRGLAFLALYNAKLVLAGHRPHRPVTVAARPRPELTLTYLGRADDYADLPWAAEPSGRRMLDMLTPAGPQAITVAIEELDGVLHATASYHRNVFDPAQVAAAVAAVFTDPADLLPGPAR